MKQALFRRVFGKSIFQGLDVENVVVLGTDQNLWLEHGPFGNLPPTRQQIDGNVEAFDAVDANTIYVLGSNGALWLEHGPFGAVPPQRQQVDGNVAAFDAIDANTIYVLGSNGALWLEHGPFGSVPPRREQVDGNVAAFGAVDANTIYVLGSDGKLWLEFGPFSTVPPRRAIVDALGFPSTLVWNGGVGFGSGATNANSNFSLSMSSNGTVMFSGQYNDTGSIPIFTSPTQNWVAAVAVPAGGRLLAFTISGSTPSASSTTWNVPGSNQQISLLWPLIFGQRSTFRVSNSSDLGSILNQIENDLSEVVTIIGDVLPIIAAIAG